jgi:hypothetical protein
MENSQPEQYTPEQTAQRDDAERDRIVQRMLSTPYQGQIKPPKKIPKPRRKRQPPESPNGSQS